MESESPKYISLQEAIRYCNYSQEYLSLRARQGKLKSVKFGRKWVITKEWLDEYLKTAKKKNAGQLDAYIRTIGFRDNFFNEKRFFPLEENFNIVSSVPGRGFFSRYAIPSLLVLFLFLSGISISSLFPKEMWIGTSTTNNSVISDGAEILSETASSFKDYGVRLAASIGSDFQLIFYTNYFLGK